MGEVYRAKDSKLGRDVAIKILPSELSEDAERLARFRREAQLLASLNHPNIAAIHGLEDVDGQTFLVLELVEGEDLAERLKRGPVPLEAAREVARQVAEALEEAHDKGVVHRDLKPANIKITPEGKVKVLDFGLAKAYAGDVLDASGDLSQSPTMSRQATMAGVILGTASYMAPEQAKGKSVDRRADIWAFGVVLYEMVSGARPFQGETVSEILASVIKDEPRWSDLPRLPARFEQLVRRCLRKDPRQRLRDIGDARLELDEPDETLAPTAPRPSVLARLGWIAAAPLLAFIVFDELSTTPAPELTKIRAPLTSPGGLRLESLAISPDGERIVYAVESESGAFELWLQSLDSREAERLAGTEDASDPFWSPDSRSVGFFASSALKTLELESGFIEQVAAAPINRGGTWNADGVIVYGARDELFAVPSAGGTPRRVTPRNLEAGDINHRFPSFLPDGEHVLYFQRNPTDSERAGIWLANVESGETKRLLGAPSSAVYVDPGYLLYRRGESLVARRFDKSRHRVGSEVTGVVDDLWFDPSVSAATSFSVSGTGILVYRTGGRETTELVWLDRQGEEIDKEWEPLTFLGLELSPDGDKALLSVANEEDETRQMWVYDIETDRATQITFSGEHYRNAWSPDGTRAMDIASKAGWVLREHDLRGGTPPVIRLDDGGIFQISDWPAEDIVLLETYVGSQVDILILDPISGDKRTYKQLGSDSHFPKLSTNGRWLAYVSDLGGSSQVYVDSFPESRVAHKISTTGGYQPRWSPDGSELFFLAPDRTLMSARITEAERGFAWDPPVALFLAPVLELGPRRVTGTYGVGKDAASFLIIARREQEATPAALLLNWTKDLD